MVWRYAEYSRCPTITDWVNKEGKFSIMLAEDVLDYKPISLKTHDGQVEALQIVTNGQLRPRFYMRVGENSRSFFNLEFDSLGGLVRRIWTLKPGSIKVAGVEGEVKELRAQKIDSGRFDDFKKIGEYAARRFPFIAQEISQSPYGFTSDVPAEDRKTIEAYFDRVTEIPNLEQFQRDLSMDFYRQFKVYIVMEVGKRGLRKRENPFTKKQLEELHSLVQQLKA